VVAEVGCPAQRSPTDSPPGGASLRLAPPCGGRTKMTDRLPSFPLSLTRQQVKIQGYKHVAVARLGCLPGRLLCCKRLVAFCLPTDRPIEADIALRDRGAGWIRGFCCEFDV
jgi:hypothetical protein